MSLDHVEPVTHRVAMQAQLVGHLQLRPVVAEEAAKRLKLFIVEASDAKRKVGDMPIATQNLGGTSGLVRTVDSSGRCVAADRPFRRATGAGRLCGRVRPARPGLSQSMDDRRWLCDDTARRQS